MLDLKCVNLLLHFVNHGTKNLFFFFQLLFLSKESLDLRALMIHNRLPPMGSENIVENQSFDMDKIFLVIIYKNSFFQGDENAEKED